MGLLKLYPFYGCNNSGIFIWAGDSYVRTDKIWNLNSPDAALCDSRGILFHIGNIVNCRRGMVGFQTDSSYVMNIIWSIHIEPKNHEIVCANKKEVDQGPWSISSFKCLEIDQGPWSISSVSLMCILIRSKPPSFQSPQCTRHGKTFDTRISISWLPDLDSYAVSVGQPGDLDSRISGFSSEVDRGS